MAFDVFGEDAHGVELLLRAKTELLGYGLKDFAVGHAVGAVLVVHGVDHLLGYFDFRVEVAHHLVAYGVHAHAADAYVDAADGLLEFLFQFLLHVFHALCHFADVVDASLANEGGGGLLGECQNLDTAIGLLAACNGGHFRRP